MLTIKKNYIYANGSYFLISNTAQADYLQFNSHTDNNTLNNGYISVTINNKIIFSTLFPGLHTNKFFP